MSVHQPGQPARGSAPAAPEVYSADEVAQAAGVDRFVVRRLIAAGEIATVDGVLVAQREAARDRSVAATRTGPPESSPLRRCAARSGPRRLAVRRAVGGDIDPHPRCGRSSPGHADRGSNDQGSRPPVRYGPGATFAPGVRGRTGTGRRWRRRRAPATTATAARGAARGEPGKQPGSAARGAGRRRTGRQIPPRAPGVGSASAHRRAPDGDARGRP